MYVHEKEKGDVIQPYNLAREGLTRQGEMFSAQRGQSDIHSASFLQKSPIAWALIPRALFHLLCSAAACNLAVTVIPPGDVLCSVQGWCSFRLCPSPSWKARVYVPYDLSVMKRASSYEPNWLGELVVEKDACRIARPWLLSPWRLGPGFPVENSSAFTSLDWRIVAVESIMPVLIQ